MTGKPAAPACAACKYQRRKCKPDCPLAPYFPASEFKMFQNVHRLFGVSNVTKILKNLSPGAQREDAMTSMIYEAEMRRRFPAQGCIVVIRRLQGQLHSAVAELRWVYSQLEFYRRQANNNNKEMMMETTSFHENAAQLQMMMNQVFVDNNEDNNVMATTMMMMESNLKGIQSQMESLGFEHERNNAVFNIATAIDDSLSSTELSVKKEGGLVNQISQAELKNAAAAFSLTTVN